MNFPNFLLNSIEMRTLKSNKNKTRRNKKKSQNYESEEGSVCELHVVIIIE